MVMREVNMSETVFTIILVGLILGIATATVLILRRGK